MFIDLHMHEMRYSKDSFLSLEEIVAIAREKGLDGIEVLNGSTLKEACEKAAMYARELNLIPVGASDCHVPEKVGVYATYFPREVRNVKELVEVFKEGKLKPAYYENGKYHVINI